MLLATAMNKCWGSSHEPAPIDTKSHVPALRELVNTMIRRNGTVTCETEHGKILLKHLHKRTKMAVLMCSMPQGSSFPEHRHTVVEWLHVESGELEITVNGSEPQVLRAGETIRIQPNDAHTSTALTPVEVLAVTMPADEGFPDEQ